MKHRLKDKSRQGSLLTEKGYSRAGLWNHQGGHGFRSFMLRGFEAVKGEWNLVCMAFNIKRLYALTR